jgi:hypothetical protein
MKLRAQSWVYDGLWNFEFRTDSRLLYLLPLNGVNRTGIA